ncbi:MAG: protein-glutamate O-methyltransferase CheR [Deltaproteobacteria bacterium]|nr:protein-glutamate O-methyltransferase CheR [Deltaproteobacteria bacterium]
MAKTAEKTSELENVEIRLLLEGIYRCYGYDFRDYALASIERRFARQVEAEGATTISGLQEKVLHDAAAMERLLFAMATHVTSMFRDPSFYVAFRQTVVPLLRASKYTRIWHAGCSTGEEVYSLAILLHEEDLYNKCRIYATDFSEGVLRIAKEGVFPLTEMKEYTKDYLEAGGHATFSNYYSAKYDHVIFRPALRENVLFAHHNLVTDGSFNEFDVILCRNVMIYFNKSLQDRVHRLLYESLAPRGVLGLGQKEFLRFTPEEHHYEVLDGPERLYRKVA